MTTLPSLVAIGIVVVERYKGLVFHKISQDHVIKGLCEFTEVVVNRVTCDTSIQSQAKPKN